MNETDIKRNILELLLAFHHDVRSRDELIRFFINFSGKQNDSYLLYLKNQDLIDNQLFLFMTTQIHELMKAHDSKSRIKGLIDASCGLIQELTIQMKNLDVSSIDDFTNQFFTTSIGLRSIINSQSRIFRNSHIQYSDEDQTSS
ncbi:MAG: hypothetical protein ACKO5E_18820, partial [bacterium]